ncbi:hypothetical protein [Bradyrhizobium sp. SSUT77]|uniref:hypothetical protein n=1 Tax=Bradyrhizobium sp. SSUT77 TaxID=3040603 RepID=UPI00244C5DAD|nr:hypothetical protein [Bradyrhizobium sp. SSUT77]MDH2347423.1 hypothetical protein [Bradyrhizobium sp. SSUT77]
MRSVALLALSLLFVVVWSQDSATGQSSVAPPVSLAPLNASPPPRANVKNFRVSPTASEASTPVIGGPPPMPNPAADYDGFSAGTVDDSDTSSQAAPPVRSRTAKGSRPNPDTKGAPAQQLIDQEDEALKRKLMICQSCK